MRHRRMMTTHKEGGQRSSVGQNMGPALLILLSLVCNLLQVGAQPPPPAPITSQPTQQGITLFNLQRMLFSQRPAVVLPVPDGFGPNSSTAVQCNLSWIRCHPDGRLRSLLLDKLGITLPFSAFTPFLLNFTSIINLNINDNPIASPLDPEWGKITSVRNLYARECRAFGTLPPEWSTLVQLRQLGLGNNLLTGTLPASWSSLIRMEYLAIVALPGVVGSIPSSWSTWRNLIIMYITRTPLCGARPAFNRSTSVNRPCITDGTSIGPDASNTCLSVLPTCVAPVPSPPQLSLLPALNAMADALGIEKVPCDPCDMTCTNRAWAYCGASPQLSLSLRSRGLTGTLDSLTFSLSLLGSSSGKYIMLDLRNNSFTGTLPPTWSTISNLTYLYLANNTLTGPLPGAWVGMTSLQELDLADNKLQSTLPDEWGGMNSLIYLMLASNNLQGTLSAAWGNMMRLEELNLSNNKLISGIIPTAWGKLSSLKRFLMRSVPRVVGFIPPEWDNSLLQYTRLQGTALCLTAESRDLIRTGLQPCRLSQLLSHLYYELGSPARLQNPLDVPANRLPWANATSLNVAGVVAKAFFPDIAIVLQELAGLGILSMNLSNNQLTGTLPLALLSNLPPTSRLVLSRNKLSGTLPDPFKIPLYLDLSNNIFISNLPLRILPAIFVADNVLVNSNFTLILDNNSLVGAIPDTWEVVLASWERGWSRTLNASNNRLCQPFAIGFSTTTTNIPACNDRSLAAVPFRLGMPASSLPAGSSAYFYYTPTAYNNASTSCAMRGGSLMTPSDNTQYAQLVNALQDIDRVFKLQYTLPEVPVYNRAIQYSGFWLGLVRDSNDGTGNFCPADNPLRWGNGTLMKRSSQGGTLDQFVAPQPSAYLSAECCAAVSLLSTGENTPPEYSWFMFGCQALLPYVCVQQDCVTSVEGAGTSVLLLSAKYGTTPWQIWRDNPTLGARKSTTTTGPVLLCPGVDGQRFSGIGASPIGDCLNDLPRPCAGVSPQQDQANCFCSYHDDGYYQWPFDKGTALGCTRFVRCRGLTAVGNVQSCPSGQVFSEVNAGTSPLLPGIPLNPSSGSGFCIAGSNRYCSDRCARPECLCKELLLGAGMYRNPFDASGATGVECDRFGNNTDLVTCSNVSNDFFAPFFEPVTGNCTGSLPRCTKPLESYGGCEYTFIEQFDPNTYQEVDDTSLRRRHLLQFSPADDSLGLRPRSVGRPTRPMRGEASGATSLWRPARQLLVYGVMPRTVPKVSCTAKQNAIRNVLGCAFSPQNTVTPASPRFKNCFCMWRGECPEASLGTCKGRLP